MSAARANQAPDLFLPLTILSRYLYFLGRRPLSASNSHFLTRRIRGLQTLSAFLQDRDDPMIEQLAGQLLALTSANLFRQSTTLQMALKQRTAETLPRGIVVSSEAPDLAFWQGIQKILLIFGPGIGIGDETICFRIAAALRAMIPSAAIEVLSSYAGLWNGVPHVSSVKTYRGDRELVEAFRAVHETNDLIFFADFEPSGLTPSVCHEPAIGRFVELSLGTRAISAFDARSRQLFRMPAVDPYFANFYTCLERMLRWLGAGGSLFPEPLIKRTPDGDAKKELVVLVSPFTSKEDPSEGYWSRLIAQMIPPELPRPVKIVIDTGATHASASFAWALSRSALSHAHPDLRCQTAHCETGRNVPLPEMFRCVQEADVVVTADSFPAHAAAAFGRLTFVLGRQGVENWRAPSPASFYLPAEAPVNQIASAIRSVLRVSHTAASEPVRPDLRNTRKFQSLRGATALVAETLATAHPWETLVRRWEQFTAIYRESTSGISEWPDELAVLLADRPYPQLCGLAPARDSEAARIWLADEFSLWTNSNLYKYLGLQPAAKADGES
jgi:hypothetical protein